MEAAAMHFLHAELHGYPVSSFCMDFHNSVQRSSSLCFFFLNYFIYLLTTMFCAVISALGDGCIYFFLSMGSTLSIEFSLVPEKNNYLEHCKFT